MTFNPVDSHASKMILPSVLKGYQTPPWVLLLRFQMVEYSDRRCILKCWHTIQSIFRRLSNEQHPPYPNVSTRRSATPWPTMTYWHRNAQRTSNVEIWRFLLCYIMQVVEQTVDTLVIWDAITLMRYHCNVIESRILISVKVIFDMICINHRVKQYNLNENWTNRLVLIRNDVRISVSQNLYCWTSIPQAYPSLWEHFQSKASV